MTITINTKYKIESDALNIILQEKKVHKTTGKEYFTNVGYYPNLKSAFNAMVKSEIMQSDLQGVTEILNKLDEIDEMLTLKLNDLKHFKILG